MPFGGSGLNYTLSYTVQVIGGPAAGGQISGVSQAIDKVDASNKKAAASSNQFAQGQKGAEGAVQSHNKALKGLVFGLTGMVSSGVEAIGMFGMYTDAQTRMTEATQRVSEATKLYGQDSKQARDATAEQEKAERALNMVRRNTILSGFDMLTWVTLTVTQLKKMDLSLSSVTGVFGKLGNAMRNIASRGAGSGIGAMATDMGILNKAVATSATPMSQLSTASKTLSTNLKMAATSATPLGGAIAASSGAMQGATVSTNLFSRALQFLKANIRGVMLATGIGALIVGLTMLAEHFMATADAAKQGMDGVEQSTTAASGDISSLLDAADAVDTAITTNFEDISTGLKDTAKAVFDEMVGMANKFNITMDEAKLKVMELELQAQKAKRDEIDRRRTAVMDPKSGKTQWIFFNDADKAAFTKINESVHTLERNIKTTKANLGKPPSMGDAVLPAKSIAQIKTTSGLVVKSAVEMGQKIVAAVKPDVFAGNIDEAKVAMAAMGKEFELRGANVQAVGIAMNYATEALDTFLKPAEKTEKTAKKAAEGLQGLGRSAEYVQGTFTGIESQADEAANTIGADEIAIRHLDMIMADTGTTMTYVEGKMRDIGSAADEMTIGSEDASQTFAQNMASMVDDSDMLSEALDEHVSGTTQLEEAEASLAEKMAFTSEEEQNQMKIAAAHNAVELNLNSTLLSQAQSLGMSANEMNALTGNALMATDDINQLNDELIDENMLLIQNQNSLMLGAQAYQQYNMGMNEGIAAAGAFLNQLNKNEAAANGFVNALTKLAGEGDKNAQMFVGLTKNLNFTDEELQQVISSSTDFESAIENIANALDKQASPALEHFNAMINAFNEDKKGKKESKKDLKKRLEQFGLDDKTIDTIVKNTEKLQKTAKLIDDLDLGIESISQLANAGQEGSKAMTKTGNEIIKVWDDLVAKDSDLQNVSGYADMVKAAAEGSDPAIDKVNEFNIKLKEFWENDNNITENEAAVLNRILNEGDAFETSAGQVGMLTEEQQKIADNNTLDRTIIQVTTDLNLQARTIRGLTSDWNQLVLIQQKAPFGATNVNDIPPGSSLGGGGALGGGFQQPQLPMSFTPQQAKQMGGDIGLVGKAMKGLEIIAQQLQTGIANLANQGANSMNILAKASSKAMQGFINNLNKGYVSAGHIQTGIANLANEGSASLSALAKTSSKQMQGFIKNLNKGYESAGHLQEGLANLANEGSASLSALAKASSRAMNGMINNFEKGISAAHRLTSAINAIPSGGGGGFEMAQTGMHKTLQGDTLIMAHKGERVDIGPDHGISLGAFSVAKGSGSRMEVINFRIAGNDIINEKTLTRRITTGVGKNRDRFG